MKVAFILAVVAAVLAGPRAACPSRAQQLREALSAVGWSWDCWSPPADLGASFGSPQEFVSCLTSFLKDDDARLRGGAANVLGGVGQEAAPARASLVTMLVDDDDPRVRCQAVKAVARIMGAEGVEHIQQALKDRSTLVRVCAIRSIMPFGEAAADAVPLLTEALQDSGTYVHYVASGACENRPVRYLAAVALGRVGTKATSALPALRHMLAHDGNQWARCAAAFAVASVDPEDTSGVARLLQMFTNDRSAQSFYEECLRHEALDYLVELREKARPALPAIMDRLRNDRSEFIRMLCVEALLKVRAADDETLAILTKALRDEHPDVQGEVLETIEQLGRRASVAAPSVIRFLRDILGKRPRQTFFGEDMRVAALRTVLASADAPSAASILLEVLWNAPCEELYDKMVRVLDSPMPNAQELADELKKHLPKAEEEMAHLINEVIARIQDAGNEPR